MTYKIGHSLNVFSFNYLNVFVLYIYGSHFKIFYTT